jgi:serine/threonine protein kinase
MSYCLNPRCPNPQNPVDARFCLSCGTKLLLKERYRAVKPIGQGGFGRTFLAVDEDKPSKPYCVIKQFYPQAQGTNTVQKAVQLFNQEALRLDELGKHPQIPELLAHFTQENRQYLVQEFIDGQNLAQELQQRLALSESQIRQLLNDLLPVLQFCHDCQVIHRDIKPENIIRRRSNGKLVLVDFGASKFATQTTLNRTGTSIGSPEYVALEQLRGRAVFASDIYSLGATCIHLLTGRSPFDLYDINTDTWIWRQYVKTPVSYQLSRILDKMLETTLSQRYQTAAAVEQDLNALAPTTPNPVTQLIPSPITPSQLDSELEEIKSQFLGKPKPKTEIDMELEQLKSKYLGNNGQV